MIHYRIGDLAEHIIAVGIDRDGTITPMVRWRGLSGVVADVVEQQCARALSVSQAEFVVRVAQGSSGVVEVVPPHRCGGIARTVIPIGPSRPFLESELPPSPGANGAFSFSEAVRFTFSAGALAWSTENMGGRIVLSALCPEVSVVLRLPSGNLGELSFSTPLFRHADGSARRVLSAA